MLRKNSGLRESRERLQDSSFRLRSHFRTRRGSVSPGSTVKTVEFKMSLLAGVQGDLLAIGEVVRKGRSLATCRLEVVGGNDHVAAIGLATYALQAVLNRPGFSGDSNS